MNAFTNLPFLFSNFYLYCQPKKGLHFTFFFIFAQPNSLFSCWLKQQEDFFYAYITWCPTEINFGSGFSKFKIVHPLGPNRNYQKGPIQNESGLRIRSIGWLRLAINNYFSTLALSFKRHISPIQPDCLWQYQTICSYLKQGWQTVSTAKIHSWKEDSK